MKKGLGLRVKPEHFEGMVRQIHAENAQRFLGKSYEIRRLPCSMSKEGVQEFVAPWKVTPVATFRERMTRTWIVRAEHEPEKRAIQHQWGLAVINESFPRPKPAAAKQTWAWKPQANMTGTSGKSDGEWPRLSPPKTSTGQTRAVGGASGTRPSLPPLGNGGGPSSPGVAAPVSTVQGTAQQEGMEVDAGVLPAAGTPGARDQANSAVPSGQQPPDLASMIQTAVQAAMGVVTQQMSEQLVGLQQGFGALQSELMALKAAEEDIDAVEGEAGQPRPAAGAVPNGPAVPAPIPKRSCTISIADIKC